MTTAGDVARVGSRGLARDAERTTCGTLLTDGSLGVAHPVLPCGAKLFLLHDGQEVLTEVIDNRMSSAQRQFELTPRLAAQLGSKAAGAALALRGARLIRTSG